MCLSKSVRALRLYEGKANCIWRQWSGERKLLLSIGRILTDKHCRLKVFQSEGTGRRNGMEAVHVGDSVSFNSEYPGCGGRMTEGWTGRTPGKSPLDSTEYTTVRS